MSLEEIAGPDPHCCKDKTKEESLQTSPVPKMKQLIELVGCGKGYTQRPGWIEYVLQYTYTVVIEERSAHTFGIILSRKPVVDRKNGTIVKPTVTTWNEEGSQLQRKRVDQARRCVHDQQTQIKTRAHQPNPREPFASSHAPSTGGSHLADILRSRSEEIKPGHL
jgi:hypothetical protein